MIVVIGEAVVWCVVVTLVVLGGMIVFSLGFMAVLFDDHGAPMWSVLVRPAMPLVLSFWIPAALLVILRVSRISMVAAPAAAALGLVLLFDRHLFVACSLLLAKLLG
jgi:hypothetical protein